MIFFYVTEVIFTRVIVTDFFLDFRFPNNWTIKIWNYLSYILIYI